MSRRRKRKIKFKNIFILLSITIIILLALYLFINKPKTSKPKIDKPKEEVKEIKTYTASLVMVGDALINDLLYTDANRVANYNGYNFKPYLKLIKESIKDYDLAYYNQETILGGTDIGVSSYPAFNSPYEVGDAMIDAGFNLVSLATNHTLDRGEKAIINSRNYWNKQSSVHAIGSYSSNEEKNEIESQVLEVNNIKYAILNYTYGTNGIRVPSGKEYLVNLWDVTNNYENYKETVKNDIEKVRDKVDVLIVAMHWGIEYTHEPIKIQKDMAKFLADNNVDIIIGTHPHVIEPVEWIGDTIVFYSLGNFISSQTSESCINYKCNIGLMSSLKITKTIDEDNTNIKIDNIENNLIYTYNNNHKDYLVIPFSNKEIKNYLKDYENIYNNYSKIVKSIDNDMTVLPIGT